MDHVTLFTKNWIEAWNKHDIDAIMLHYSPDIVFSSPLIVKILGKADGTIQGKAELRAYFLMGLAKYPDLKFELRSFLTGIDSLVIYYKSVNDLVGAEVMLFNKGGLVSKCIANYTTE